MNPIYVTCIKIKVGVNIMDKQKKLFYRIAAIEAIFIAMYLFASLMKNELLCSILSATNAAIATTVLSYSYVLSKNKSTSGIALMLYAIACIAWFAADILWIVSYAAGGDPTQSIVITYIYTLTNVFLGAGVLIFSLYYFRKWISVQLILDTLIITVNSILLVWIAFFHKDNVWLELFLQDGISSAASITLDFLAIIGIFIAVYSISKKKIPVYIILCMSGILIYAFTDLYYYYIYANNQYIPNSLLDVMYVASLLILSIGALWRTLITPDEDDAYEQMTKGRNWLLLFLYPLAAIISEGFVFNDVLHFFVSIVMYKVLSGYIQIAVEKDILYRKEVEINISLEKRVEEQYGELVYLANNDTVTNLFNRRYFLRALENAIDEMKNGELLAVYLIDLDRFKTINDTLGHDVGDKVLIKVSERMHKCMNDGAVLARLGGDEFALFVRGKNSHEYLERIAKDIIHSCSAPLFIGDNQLQITLSIGISMCPVDADNQVALLRNADIAMYRAKSQGYNTFVFYDPFFIKSIGKKSEIEVLLRKANIEKDFELFYQPQFDLATNRLIGAEALLSWKNAEHGYIPPKEFIPVAEEIDYMIRIGKWVMNEAVRQIIKWNTTHSVDLKMGINISPKQLQEDDFVNMMKNLINHENFNTTWIDAEITENIFHESDNRTNEILDILKELRVSVSVDEFGSGVSSLGYLNKFSFDRIKIDKSLIEPLCNGNNSGIRLVKAVVSMANAIGINTIAEGVENEEQLSLLKKLKCHQAQGSFLGRPVCAAEFENLFILCQT